MAYTRNCVKDGIVLKTQVGNKLKDPFTDLQVLLTMFSTKTREMNPTSLSVNESLTCIPLFDSSERQKLLKELPSYLAKAADVDRNLDQMQWWKLHATTLPNWLRAAKNGSHTTIICSGRDSILSPQGHGITRLCHSINYAPIQ